MDEQMSSTDGTLGGWSTLTLVATPGAGTHHEVLRWIERHPAVRQVRVVGIEPRSGRRDASDHQGLAAALRTACPEVDVTVDARTWDPADPGSADELVVVGSVRSPRGSTNGRTPSRIAERCASPTIVVPDAPHLIDGDVVLAVDEPLDDRALRIAVHEAVSRHRRLTLVRAWEMPVVTRTGLTDFAEDPLRWRRVDAEVLDRVTATVRARFPHLRVHPLLVEGHPGRAIATHTRHASLVVLGQGHVRLLSGGVLHDLLRATAAPVCIVPATRPDVEGSADRAQAERRVPA